MPVPRSQKRRAARQHSVLVAATFAAALLGWSASVRADPKAAAQAQFEAGREAAKRGDCQAAIDHFSRARAFYATAGSLYNIADCEERIGRLVSARAHWAELLGELTATDERVADAKARLEALDRRIPTVKIVLPPGASEGTSTELDGAPVVSEKLGAEQPIDPGQHAIVVTAPGRARRSTTVVVAEGARGFIVQGELGGIEATAPVLLAPTKEASPRGADEGQVNTGAQTRSTLAYVAGTVGLVGLATTALGAVVLLGKKTSIAEHCDASKACDDTGFGATGGVATWSAIGTVGFGVGALGIAGFFLLPREGERATSGDLRALALSPAVGPEFVGARLAGRW